MRLRQRCRLHAEDKILAHVRGSNRCHVQVVHDRRSGKVLAMSAIDNLVKGAAGQAVQCLNLARGWPETLGLGHAPLFP